MIYSISTLVCSICAGVFNVNPQSGIEFPREGVVVVGGDSLLIVQLKSRAISGHMGPRFLCTIKRHTEYIHGEHSVLRRAAGHIRHATN